MKIKEIPSGLLNVFMWDLMLNCGFVTLLAEIPLPHIIINYPYKLEKEEGIWSLLLTL